MLTDLFVYSRKIFDEINKAVHILVITHRMPDGDAIGSVCAISEYLLRIRKNFRIFCVDKPTKQFEFLPNFELFDNDKKLFEKKWFDLVLIFDTGDFNRAGIENLINTMPNNPKIINIDHHATNKYFGNINYVDPFASSTTQILYKLFKDNYIEINKDMAECLLAGLITDTSGFSNPGTTFGSIEAASDLLKTGARFPKIVNKIAKDKTIPMLKVWGKIFSGLIENKKYNIVSAVIPKTIAQEFNVSEEEIGGIANFMNNLKDADVIFVLKELEEGKIKGSFRTVKDEIDVSKLARIFGGNGHKKAAGFLLDARLIQSPDGYKVV